MIQKNNLDEPFNGLDISLQKFIWQLLKEKASEGRIIIISSHMLEDIQKYCNEFGLVEKCAFYSTQEVLSAVKKTGGKNLELFLEQLFTKDQARD
jgi:ABC-type multidrug transport system ATPase subunit